MSSGMGNARGGHEDDLDDGDHVDKEVEHVEFVSKVVPRSHAEKFDNLSAAWCKSRFGRGALRAMRALTISTMYAHVSK